MQRKVEFLGKGHLTSDSRYHFVLLLFIFFGLWLHLFLLALPFPLLFFLLFLRPHRVNDRDLSSVRLEITGIKFGSKCGDQKLGSRGNSRWLRPKQERKMKRICKIVLPVESFLENGRRCRQTMQPKKFNSSLYHLPRTNRRIESGNWGHM